MNWSLIFGLVILQLEGWLVIRCGVWKGADVIGEYPEFVDFLFSNIFRRRPGEWIWEHQMEQENKTMWLDAGATL